MKFPANTKKTGKRKPTPSAWKKGQSGNPHGAPKRGESWREIWDKIGNLTPKEAAEHSKVIAAQIASIGDKVTLKEAVALRVYTSLLFEPSSGLLNAVMERTDGKVMQPIGVSWLDRARSIGLSAEEAQSLYADLVTAARERLARIHANGSLGAGTIREDSESAT